VSDFFNSIFGGIDNSSQQLQTQANQQALNLIERNTQQARADALGLFPQADAARNLGLDQGFNLLAGQALPQQQEKLRAGSVGAQNALLAGLPQIQNAILGGPVDNSALQAQDLGPISFAGQQAGQSAPVNLPPANLPPVTQAPLSPVSGGGSGGGFDFGNAAGLLGGASALSGLFGGPTGSSILSGLFGGGSTGLNAGDPGGSLLSTLGSKAASGLSSLLGGGGATTLGGSAGDFAGVNFAGGGAAPGGGFLSGAGGAAAPIALAAFGKSRQSSRQAKEAAQVTPLTNQISAAKGQSIQTSRGAETRFAFTDPNTGNQLFANQLSKDDPKTGKARAIGDVWNPATGEFGIWRAQGGFVPISALRRESAQRQREINQDRGIEDTQFIERSGGTGN